MSAVAGARVRHAAAGRGPTEAEIHRVAGRVKGDRHQLARASGWQRDRLGNDLQTDRRIRVGNGGNQGPLASSSRESHDDERVLQQGQPDRQLVLERHDPGLLSSGGSGTTGRTRRLVVCSATAWRMYGEARTARAGSGETYRSADNARVAVAWTALETARRFASLNVNGISPNLLLPARA